MELSKAQQRIAQKNREYWSKREEEQLKHYIKNEAEYSRQINRIYSDMLDNCQKEIDSFYGKYASKEGITIAEAKKRVSQLDIEAYERKAARYVKDRDFSAKANEEMRLYNLTMKVNRLEMLKANIGLELISGHDELDKFMADILQGRSEQELERQAGILGKTIQNNAKAAHSIVNASFHNATFSERIWANMDLLRAEIGKNLQTGMIAGKNPRVLARDIKKTFDTSKYNAERLMRTEMARVQVDSQFKSITKNGFTQYQFIVNSGCCDICQAVAKKNDGIYNISDAMPGDNAPPIHPNCRCSVASYEDDEEYEAWLDYLANGGTTEQWNALKIGKLDTKHGMQTAKTDFVPAKSIAEAEQYAQRFVSDYKSKYTGNVSYKGIDLETANKINSVLTAVYDKYDVEKIGNILPMNAREKRWKGTSAEAAYQWGNGGTLYFNPKYYKSKKTIAAHIKECQDLTKTVIDGADLLLSNPHTNDAKRRYLEAIKTTKRGNVQVNLKNGGDFSECTFVHEMGHMLDDKIFKLQTTGSQIDMNESMEKYAGGISGYATTSKAEYVAESFAAWWYGESDIVDPQLVEIFERGNKK